LVELICTLQVCSFNSRYLHDSLFSEKSASSYVFF